MKQKILMVIAILSLLVLSIGAVASHNSRANGYTNSRTNNGWVYACGNGVCEVGEDCEWNGKLGRQMLCDGSGRSVPSNKACSACRLYAGCGNGICSGSEQCEWSGYLGRQIMCDGKQSRVPSDMKCSSCRLYNACWK